MCVCARRHAHLVGGGTFEEPRGSLPDRCRTWVMNAGLERCGPKTQCDFEPMRTQRHICQTINTGYCGTLELKS